MSSDTKLSKQSLIHDVTSSFSLDNYGKIEMNDLQKISAIHERVEALICGTDSIHEDIIEFMLKPFEDILKHHGVNLSEQDF